MPVDHDDSPTSRGGVAMITWARRRKKRNPPKHTITWEEKKHILSTDDFFMQNDKYVFNPEHLAENHRKNQELVEQRMKEEMTPLFIDNTNIEPAHMWWYVILASIYGYKVRVVNMKDYVTDQNPIWDEKTGTINRELLYRRAQERRDSGSGKDISKEVIDKMCDRYEQIPVLTLADIHRANNKKTAAVGKTVQGTDGRVWGKITHGPMWKLDNGTMIQVQNENLRWTVTRS